MKNLFLSFLLFFIVTAVYSQPVKVMLVTGGHSFDTVQFFQMFDKLEGVEYEHFQQPKANAAIAAGLAGKFDVLVFYDMWKTLSEPEKNAYMELTRQGKPFLFLHHSLVSYQEWPEFEKLLGGKYVEKSPDVPIAKQSTYQHDVWVDIQVTGKHPVTDGFESLKLFDEVYGNFRVSQNVIPLLKTNHPQSTEIIGWENRYNSSKIIYLQPGHDYHTFESEDFRRLILQAITYLTKTR